MGLSIAGSEYVDEATLDTLIDISLAVAILALTVVKRTPNLQRFIKYGKTIDERLSGQGIMEKLAALRVPKHWFTHFYVFSVLECCVALWWVGFDIGNKYSLALCLSLVQSARRCYECIFVSKKSLARMHVFHYAVGVYFYAVVNLNSVLKYRREGAERPANVWGAIPLFIACSIDQWRNHVYLASLKKYTLPDKGLFAYCASAHYFDEIVLYFAEWLLLQNRTSFLIMLWVATSLTISAIETFQYYKSQDNGHLKPKYVIIPFIY